MRASAGAAARLHDRRSKVGQVNLIVRSSGIIRQLRGVETSGLSPTGMGWHRVNNACQAVTGGLAAEGLVVAAARRLEGLEMAETGVVLAFSCVVFGIGQSPGVITPAFARTGLS